MTWRLEWIPLRLLWLQEQLWCQKMSCGLVMISPLLLGRIWMLSMPVLCDDGWGQASLLEIVPLRCTWTKELPYPLSTCWKYSTHLCTFPWMPSTSEDVGRVDQVWLDVVSPRFLRGFENPPITRTSELLTTRAQLPSDPCRRANCFLPGSRKIRHNKWGGLLFTNSPFANGQPEPWTQNGFL